MNASDPSHARQRPTTSANDRMIAELERMIESRERATLLARLSAGRR